MATLIGIQPKLFLSDILFLLPSSKLTYVQICLLNITWPTRLMPTYPPQMIQLTTPFLLTLRQMFIVPSRYKSVITESAHAPHEESQRLYNNFIALSLEAVGSIALPVLAQ